MTGQPQIGGPRSSGGTGSKRTHGLKAAAFLHRLALQIRRLPERRRLLEGNKGLVAAIILGVSSPALRKPSKSKSPRGLLLVSRGIAGVAAKERSADVDFILGRGRRRPSLSWIPWLGPDGARSDKRSVRQTISSPSRPCAWSPGR